MSTYLLLSLLLLIGTLAFSFTRRFAFYKDFLFVIPAILISTSAFILIDFFFTEWAVWGYNEGHNSGVLFFGIPMEQYFVYLSFSYYGLFVYAFVKHNIKQNFFRHFNKILLNGFSNKKPNKLRLTSGCWHYTRELWL